MCMHTKIRTYVHTHIHTYIHTRVKLLSVSIKAVSKHLSTIKNKILLSCDTIVVAQSWRLETLSHGLPSG
jgi:hypothetical protein